LNIAIEITALERHTIKQLQARYAELFGEETRAHHKPWLIKRIAWRIQALAEGDLSQRARQRALELANDADLRLSPPKVKVVASVPERTMTVDVPQQDGDRRLPIPGTVISRPYKGQMLQVKVLPRGFEFEGEIFKSLSAVAKRITGQHCNGFLFFRLRKEAAK